MAFPLFQINAVFFIVRHNLRFQGHHYVSFVSFIPLFLSGQDNFLNCFSSSLHTQLDVPFISKKMTTSFWTSLDALIHKVIYCSEEPLLYCIHCIIASCIIHILLNCSFGLLKKQSFLSNVMFVKCNNGTVAKLANTVFKHDIGENNV